MAIITGNIERILLKYPNIDLRKIKLVGWGAGQYFKYQYPLIKDHLKIEYTVCPNENNQNKELFGIKVFSPEILRKESQKNLVVVIFAERYFDIMHALRDEFGDINCINACTLERNLDILSQMEDFQQLDLSPIKRRWKKPPKLGIFVQGMAMAHTPYVLSWNRMYHPNAYQCMVTWDHIDPDLLNQCRPWLDKLILVPQPEKTGLLFLNAALRSARIGVENLANQGIDFSVRCRSDNILYGSLNSVIERHFSRNRNHGKIAISIHSWPQIPFMFSEKAMVARTHDMLKLWSMPEDIKDTDHADYKVANDAHFLKLSHAVPEVILWRHYAKNLGLPTENIEDSYNFLRNHLLPLEPDLRWQSLKFTPLFNIQANYNRHWKIEQWREIINDPEGSNEYARSLQNLEMSVEDFWQRKIG